MFSKSLAFAMLLLLLPPLVLASIKEFVFNGFNDSAGWALHGSAVILPNGILSLAATNSVYTPYYSQSHAFYTSPFQIRNLTDGSIFSFSATCAFAIMEPHDESPHSSLYRYRRSTYDGITLVLAPNTSSLTTVTTYGSFGVLDPNDNSKSSNLMFIEIDTSYNREFYDIDDNHVGININSLNSTRSSPAGYYTDDPFSDLQPLRLSSGKEMQVWIDYDHRHMQLNVSLAPISMPKPKHPLLSHNINLSQVLLDEIYAGFSSSWSGYLPGYFVLGCSFTVNGESAQLDYSKLPEINTTQIGASGVDSTRSKRTKKFPLITSFALLCLVLFFIPLAAVIRCVRRYRRRYKEIREDWELDFGPHRFSYKDLFNATDGFKDKQLLGAGGFGKVYKGALASSKLEVAVKVMSHDSKQGMKEFIAEVVSMGRLRHRNLVQLLGYCRRKGELLLVYEYMSNGSLDKHLYNLEMPSLGWPQRFEIIKGIASGLLYLHEEWEQVVIHRDVKASNVLLDIPEPKPKHSLLSHNIDLSQVLLDYMYVGFSSSSWDSYGCFILGCSFKVNGEPASLDYSKLPKANTTQLGASRGHLFSATIWYSRIRIFLVLVFLGSAGTIILLVPIILVVRRCYRFREIREDWELEFGPHRFSYKDLFHATDGFKDNQLLGTGGFGKVYKGLLPLSKQEVAVKVMSHDSKQGMKEFVAEVVSMGRLRHRNLVQLLGYCRRKGELLLVYEYMPNGSLDKHLYNHDLEKPSLGWALRFEIIKGVASGLFYLHEEWEQVVIHRDVKASNVLLDGEMNGRLGDFGQARLHDHGVEAHTTCVAGTRGYISPELARLGKATKATDVFAFGAFILEVASGRWPIGVNSRGEPQVLVDFVLRFWQRDLVVCMMDPRLGDEYVIEEAELELKLGLLCSHPSPASRPTMRLVMQYLCGDTPFPEMPDAYLNIRSISELHDNEIASGEYNVQYTSVQTSISSLSGGR